MVGLYLSRIGGANGGRLFPAPLGVGVEVEAALKPLVQDAVVFDDLPFHEDEAGHGASGEVHFAAAGLGEGVRVGVGADSGHEVIANEADTHFAVHHDAQAAHHSFFLEGDRPLLEETCDAVG